MFFLAPIIGTICSAAAGIGTSALAAGSAIGSSALAAGSALGSSALTAGGTLAAAGKALATGGSLATAGSTLAAAGRTLATGAKVLTLEEASKYAGAAYIGYRVAEHRQRKSGDQQPANQNQGRREPRILYYVETAEGLVPVYSER